MDSDKELVKERQDLIRKVDNSSSDMSESELVSARRRISELAIEIHLKIYDDIEFDRKSVMRSGHLVRKPSEAHDLLKSKYLEYKRLRRRAEALLSDLDESLRQGVALSKSLKELSEDFDKKKPLDPDLLAVFDEIVRY